jgi:hypothetical protein
VLPAAVGAGEVDLDATIVEEAGKTIPARERVADRPRDGRLAGDGGKLNFEPEVQGIDEGLGTPLSRLAAFIGGEAANAGFDGIERGDADQGLGGDRRGRLHLDAACPIPSSSTISRRRRPTRGYAK